VNVAVISVGHVATTAPLAGVLLSSAAWAAAGRGAQDVERDRG